MSERVSISYVKIHLHADRNNKISYKNQNRLLYHTVNMLISAVEYGILI